MSVYNWIMERIKPAPGGIVPQPDYKLTINKAMEKEVIIDKLRKMADALENNDAELTSCGTTVFGDAIHEDISVCIRHKNIQPVSFGYNGDNYFEEE